MYKITSEDQVRPTSANVKEVDVRQDDPSGMVLSSRSDDLTAWLVAARGGDSVALGDLLQAFRRYLSSIAERDAPAMLRGKCDVADTVQETLLGGKKGHVALLSVVLPWPPSRTQARRQAEARLLTPLVQDSVPHAQPRDTRCRNRWRPRLRVAL